MQRILSLLSAFILLTVIGCAPSATLQKDAALQEKAEQLAQRFIIVDTHIDVPERLKDKMEDVAGPTGGEFDYPRARKGGLDAPFMSIFTPAEDEPKGVSKQNAELLIDMTHTIIQQNPDKFAAANSPADILANTKAGRISLPMGMENGSPIEGKLENVAYFFNRGIRYITLTHGKDNHISDSSYDTTHTWKGLSPFGRQVVTEMNRIGIMVDISHVSDDAFYQTMAITKAPAIASHSSCRFFTPGFERNMSDDMIKALAANGGVIQINFGSSFLSGEYQKRESAGEKEIRAYFAANKLSWRDSAGQAYYHQYAKDHPIQEADVKDVADHIDHVVKLAGIDHVGIGSDFDGVGDSLPTGLKDVSQYPNLIYELLVRGYSEEDIEKICGKNLLRVWQKTIEVASQIRQGS